MALQFQYIFSGVTVWCLKKQSQDLIKSSTLCIGYPNQMCVSRL